MTREPCADPISHKKPVSNCTKEDLFLRSDQSLILEIRFAYESASSRCVILVILYEPDCQLVIGYARLLRDAGCMLQCSATWAGRRIAYISVYRNTIIGQARIADALVLFLVVARAGAASSLLFSASSLTIRFLKVTFLRVSFLAVIFLAVTFLTVTILTVTFLTVTFLTVTFLTVIFLRVIVLTVTFLTVTFLKVIFLTVSSLAVTLLATPFLTVTVLFLTVTCPAFSFTATFLSVPSRQPFSL